MVAREDSNPQPQRYEPAALTPLASPPQRKSGLTDLRKNKPRRRGCGARRQRRHAYLSHSTPPSIFVEESLNVLRAGRFCQRQRQQDGGLLRTQVVGNHHVGLVPIVVANDAPFSDPRALHHNGAAVLDDLPKFLVEISWRTGSHTGDDDSFCTKALASPGRVPV